MKPMSHFNSQTEKISSVTTKIQKTSEGSEFIVGVENSSHATSDVKATYCRYFISKPEKKSEESEQSVSVVSVQVQIYYNIYYYTTGLQFMSAYSSRKENFPLRLMLACYSNVSMLR